MLLSFLSLYLFVSVLLSSFITAYAVAKGRTLMSRLFALLGLCLSVYLFGYLMELNCVDLERMRFWNQIQYLTLPFFPPLWIAFALSQIKAIRRIRSPLILLLFVVPTLTFVLRLTNDAHGLFYSSMTLRRSAFFPVMALGKGPWYLVNATYLVSCFLLTLPYYAAYGWRLSSARKSSYLLITVGALLPLIGIAFILADPFKLGLDYAALFLPVSLASLHFALFRFDLLEVNVLARDRIFDQGEDAIILIDEMGGLADKNARALSYFPELADAVEGDDPAALLAGRGDLLKAMASSRAAERSVIGVGDGRLARVELVDVHAKNGSSAGRIVRLVDCTEECLVRERLREKASTDALTGLVNRGEFAVRFQQEFSAARARGAPLALIMLDIDHFKVVNDTFGHSGGDEALRFLGREMRSRFRSSDVVARIGGEEFAVILPGADEQAAFAVAEKFRAAVAEAEIAFEARRIGFTVSLGIACMSESCADENAMMKDADRALYDSKRDGRNRTTIARPGASVGLFR